MGLAKPPPDDHGSDLDVVRLSLLLRRRLAEAAAPHFVVEVGASDGVTTSLSLPLIAAGWSGILIEPAPRVFARLAARYRDNPRVTCVELACGDHSGPGRLYFGTDGEEGFTATLSTEDSAWFRQSRTDRFAMVEVRPLTRILTDHAAPARFGLLVVDTEGMDFEVLTGLDFAAFRPAVIVTEDYLGDPAKHQAKLGMLAGHGYRNVATVAANSVWLDAP